MVASLALMETHQIDWEVLYKRTRPTVLALARSWRLHPEEGEDLLHEAFLRAFRNRRNIREPDSGGEYLIQIAKNLLRDRWRVTARIGIPLELDAETLRSNPAFSPESLAEESESMKMLSAALRRLPHRTRHVLVSRHVRGLSYREISLQIGERPGTLAVLAFRGVRTLKEMIAA